jgi:hypothetical protein
VTKRTQSPPKAPTATGRIVMPLCTPDRSKGEIPRQTNPTAGVRDRADASPGAPPEPRGRAEQGDQTNPIAGMTPSATKRTQSRPGDRTAGGSRRTKPNGRAEQGDQTNPIAGMTTVRDETNPIPARAIDRWRVAPNGARTWGRVTERTQFSATRAGRRRPNEPKGRIWGASVRLRADRGAGEGGGSADRTQRGGRGEGARRSARGAVDPGEDLLPAGLPLVLEPGNPLHEDGVDAGVGPGRGRAAG